MATKSKLTDPDIKQYSVYLPEQVRTAAQKLADADPVARGNWSVWLERLLRSIVKRRGL